MYFCFENCLLVNIVTNFLRTHDCIAVFLCQRTTKKSLWQRVRAWLWRWYPSRLPCYVTSTPKNGCVDKSGWLMTHHLYYDTTRLLSPVGIVYKAWIKERWRKIILKRTKIDHHWCDRFRLFFYKNSYILRSPFPQAIRHAQSLMLLIYSHAPQHANFVNLGRDQSRYILGMIQ